VAPVTVLTKPFPCPGQSIFCPNDVKMPKSYLSDEPGAQRAALNHFDPYAQVWNRLLALYRMGHSVEKVELIILGGTWSSYPEPYQRFFVKRCFEAASDFDTSAQPEPYLPPSQPSSRSQHLVTLPNTPNEGEALNAYNRVVSAELRAHNNGQLHVAREEASWEELEAEHTRNEHARCRVVGLVMETRPDEVTEAEALRLRRLGATKAQIGVQSTRDHLLTLNRRGHDVATAQRALALLRRAGFKLHVHWMANLYGGTVESDIEDFKVLFNDPHLCPDELKLYPCSLIPKTELMSHYEAGRWRPYTRDELVRLLCEVMPFTPRYCRLSRVIRDIPSTDIHAGNQETNFREVAEATLRERGVALSEIRARELKRQALPSAPPELTLTCYKTSVSTELFLAWETEGYLLGFCRLSLPTTPALTPELEGAAMIREVHVYGQSLKLGEGGEGAQHQGLGRALVERAAEEAREAGFERLAVISAVGTRGYYERLGFKRGALYHHLELSS
jgi:elongator complex protein 3